MHNVSSAQTEGVCFSGGCFSFWRQWSAPIGRCQSTIAPIVGMTSPWPTGVISSAL